MYRLPPRSVLWLPIFGTVRVLRPFSKVPARARQVEASALNWVAYTETFSPLGMPEA